MEQQPGRSLRAISNAVRPRTGTRSHSQSPRKQRSATAVSGVGDAAPWDADAPNCHICNVAFSWLTRRHHCRVCGKNCCSSCSPRRKIVAGYAAPERVCNTCDTDVPLSRTHQYSDDVVLKRGELMLMDSQCVFKRVLVTLTKELMDLGASSVELLSELDPAIPALDEEGQSFCFELTSLSASSTDATEKSRFLYSARSEEERAQWVLAINAARNYSQRFSILDLFHFLYCGAGLIHMSGVSDIWRVFPDGTLVRDGRRWRWNGSFFDEPAGCFNGVAVVWRNARAPLLSDVYVWLPVLDVWEGLARFRNDRLVALNGGAELARMEGDVCAPLVLLCWLHSGGGAAHAAPQMRLSDARNEV